MGLESLLLTTKPTSVTQVSTCAKQQTPVGRRQTMSPLLLEVSFKLCGNILCDGSRLNLCLRKCLYIFYKKYFISFDFLTSCSVMKFVWDCWLLKRESWKKENKGKTISHNIIKQVKRNHWHPDYSSQSQAQFKDMNQVTETISMNIAPIKAVKGWKSLYVKIMRSANVFP